MIFVSKTRNFVSKTKNCVLKTRNFADANSALEELAARVMETEAENEMSKLVIRTAIERNKDGFDELEKETSTRFEMTHVKVEELHQAQLEGLAAAMKTVKEHQEEMQAEAREELAESILEAEDSLRRETADREQSVARLQTTLTKHLKSFGQNTSRKIAGLAAETTDRMDQQHRDLVQLIETLHTEVSQELVASQQDAAQMERDLEQRFTETQTETALVLEALRSDAEQAEVELRSDINHRFEATELASEHSQMIGRLVDQSTTKGFVNDVQTALLAAEAKFAADLESSSTDIQHKVVKVHEKLEQVDLHHCAQGLTIRAVVESELERAAADRLGLHDAVRVTRESLDTRAQGLQDALSDGLSDALNAIESEKQGLTTLIEGSTRALHLIQKLMGRPDGADIFAEFDTDGDGQISLTELQAGFRKIGEDLSDAEARAIISLAGSGEAGTIVASDFTQMGKVTKEAEALAGRMSDGMSTLATRVDAEVSGLNSSIASNISTVTAAVVQLRSDASTMLEERMMPCEQKIDKLRADTSSKYRIIPPLLAIPRAFLTDCLCLQRCWRNV